MIIVTGAAGFIGSCMVSTLMKEGYADIVAMDDFSITSKENNHKNWSTVKKIERSEALDFISLHAKDIEAVIHLGARTDTVDTDPAIFLRLNINYSKKIWEICSEHDIPLIYASSAATYGDGAFGFSDERQDVSALEPLNEYGRSKQVFDEWVLSQNLQPSFWAGLKFFNVYGPNEYHKGRMASVIFHAFNQISETGEMKLFRSHKEEYKNGEQRRDFIYVKDVCATIISLLKKKPRSAIYNLGTGKARTFMDLVNATFSAMNLEPRIRFIDIPEDIRDNYQYFTEAEMGKLEQQLGKLQFSSLEEGVTDYVRNYLSEHRYL